MISKNRVASSKIRKNPGNSAGMETLAKQGRDGARIYSRVLGKVE